MLILEPTRELASQVETAIRDFARFTNLRAAVFYGGVGYGRQNDALRAGIDIIIATPGRLLDHIEQGTCKLDHIKYLVLDEADRMLDMGFLPDVRLIVERCPRDRHTSLFSATIPVQIETLIKWAMRNPQTIEIGARRSPAIRRSARASQPGRREARAEARCVLEADDARTLELVALRVEQDDARRADLQHGDPLEADHTSPWGRDFYGPI